MTPSLFAGTVSNSKIESFRKSKSYEIRSCVYEQTGQTDGDYLSRFITLVRYNTDRCFRKRCLVWRLANRYVVERLPDVVGVGFQ